MTPVTRRILINVSLLVVAFILSVCSGLLSTHIEDRNSNAYLVLRACSRMGFVLLFHVLARLFMTFFARLRSSGRGTDDSGLKLIFRLLVRYALFLPTAVALFYFGGSVEIHILLSHWGLSVSPGLFDLSFFQFPLLFVYFVMAFFWLTLLARNSGKSITDLMEAKIRR